jgi:Zn-finger protein
MLNRLQQWEQFFRKEILKEIKVAGIPFTMENIDKIIGETSFDKRRKKNPTFDKCPYLQGEESCHPEVEDLNCFLCPCPNYDSSRLDGGCKIDSSQGKRTFHTSLPLGHIWDCSNCSINHSPGEVRTYLETNFDELRKEYEALE